MIVNGSAIRRAGVGFQTLFNAAMLGVTATHKELCQTVNSTGSLEEYIIDGGLPQFREWLGERQRQNVKVWSQTVKNREWEATVAIPRPAFRDDKLGFYATKMQQLGIAAGRAPDELLAEVIEDAFTENGYDGVPFFSASHPLRAGSQSNIQAGALSATTFGQAFTKLRNMKDYNGKKIRPVGMTDKPVLVVAANLEGTAISIVENQMDASGASNTNYNRARKVVFDLLPDNYWMLAVAGGPIAPFLFQLREEPRMVARDQVGDDSVWERNEIEYGSNGSWNVAPGLYFLAVGSTGT